MTRTHRSSLDVHQLGRAGAYCKMAATTLRRPLNLNMSSASNHFHLSLSCQSLPYMVRVAGVVIV